MLSLASSILNLEFCCCGHPAYPSVDGTLSSQKYLLRMVRALREITSASLFLGTEKLPSSYVVSLADKFSLIPFLLKNKNLSRNIADILTVFPYNGPCAVYSPIALVDGASIILKELVGYILRRDTTIQQLQKTHLRLEEVKMIIEAGDVLPRDLEVILHSQLRELAIFGSNMVEQFYQLYHWGTAIIVGFPCAKENVFDIITRFGFKKCPQENIMAVNRICKPR